MTAETFEFKYKSVTYKSKKISGFALLNAMENVKKGPGYFYRDLMLACLVEPTFKTEELEEMDADLFLHIGSEILTHHGLDLADFQKPLAG
ncbi:MAG: hypothetical protein LUQ71_10275 [Methanoregula sp.]|nr:hypothetical protein [Methanoregula sp.]